MDLKDFNLETEEVEVIKALHQLSKSGQPEQNNVISMTYLNNLLLLKQQKKMLDEQNLYNEKILKRNASLVWATWVLAGVTALLAIITAFA